MLSVIKAVTLAVPQSLPQGRAAGDAEGTPPAPSFRDEQQR